MARREGVTNIGLQLTADEFKALADFAKVEHLNKSVVIRDALAYFIPKFPAGVWNPQSRETDGKD